MAEALAPDAIEARRAASRAGFAIAPGILLAGVSGGIAFPILPDVGVRAGLPLPLIGAILAANRVGRILCGPAIGVATDRIGGRKLLLGGLVIQVGVMALYWLGVTTGRPGLFFLLGRILHGPGSACVMVAGQSLALHAGGRAHGGVAAGTVRAAMSVGMPLGIVAGGVLSSRFGDAATFEAAVVGLLAATAAGFAFVPDIRAKVATRLRFREEMRALADRRLIALGSLNFAIGFSALGMVITTLVLVVNARRISLAGLNGKETASAVMASMVIVTGAVTFLASRLAQHPRAHAWVATVGTAALAPGLLIVGLDPSVRGMCIGITILSVGTGALGSALISLVGEIAGAERRGAAVGWLQLCGDVGGALGPIVGTSLLGANVAVAYVGCAVLMACFVPAGAWLIKAMK